MWRNLVGKVIDLHSFEDSKARIEERGEGYIAECECGWNSEPKPTKEEAVIAFENHVSSYPDHEKIIEESNKSNFLSISLAVMGIIYVLSPLDVVPDYLVGVGWIEDILIGIFAIIFLKGGLENKSPKEIISDTFK